MDKLFYLGQAILRLSKIIMYEFHYGYMIPKYNENLQLCHMDTESLVYYIAADDVYEDIASDVATQFDTSDYSHKWPLFKGVNSRVIGLMKDELDRRIMTEFMALSLKLYAYGTLGAELWQKVQGSQEVCGEEDARL